MIKIFSLVLVFKLALIAALVLLTDSNDKVSITLAGYVIESSATFFFVTMLALFFIMHFILTLIYKIIGVPQKISIFLSQRQHHDIINGIKNTLLALAQQDIKLTEKSLSSLNKIPYLKTVYHLLTLQLAALQKDNKKLNAVTAELLLNEESKVAGIISLIKLERQREDWHLVINYAQDLWQIHASEWLLIVHLEALIALNNWHEILIFINDSKIKAMLGKERFANIDALAKFILATKFAKENEFNKAVTMAEYAIRRLPEFSPLIELLAYIYLQRGDFNKLIKFTHSVWPKFASAKLTEILLSCEVHFRKAKFYEKAKWIADTAPENYQSFLLLGKAALLAGQDEEASEAIKKTLQLFGQAPQACLLMAEYCHRGQVSASETGAWVQKALDGAINAAPPSSPYYLQLESMKITTTCSNDSLLINYLIA